MRERFAIELTAAPDAVPAEIRLRQFLKAAIRRHGLRCTAIRRIGPATDGQTEGQAAKPAGKAGERDGR
jgi:hypothetical protein